MIAADINIQRDAVAIYLNYLAIVPTVVFGILLIISKPILKNSWKYFLSLIIIFCSFFILTGYFTSNAFHTLSFTAFYRTLINFPQSWYLGSTFQAPRYKLYNAVRQPISYRSGSAPSNNIVFIIDESVRGDHLSLNGYERQTTQFLDELNKKGMIKNWGIAVSGTTCSMTSNNLMLTGLIELPDVTYKVYQLPTIFQYAKAMGYKTYYFDGQVSQLWNGKNSDISDYGEWITAKDLKSQNKFDIDAEIAEKVKEITTASTGNFIWINKVGVHKPYKNSYPNTETVWQPVSSDEDFTVIYDKNETKEKIENEYDNAIKYNSNSFFRTLFDKGIPSASFFIYTSDHGQSLSENGETVSHCSNTKNEANVPLFMIANVKDLSQVDTEYKAAHANLFATILDLMDFPEDKRTYNYAISLLKAKAADSQERYYFVGDLFGKGRSKKYLFDK